MYYGSYYTDYIIMNGFNQEELGLSKEEQDLFGDLTVWGGPVEIAATNYSWTYDYQAKTNGYYDDGFTVKFTTNEQGTESVTYDETSATIALFGKDTLVVTVTGEDDPTTHNNNEGAVHHVGENKKNTVTYAIYRDGEDVTDDVKKYYQISVDEESGVLSITPRTVEITSSSNIKEYDGTALTNRLITESCEDRDEGFVFGEGAAYEVCGSQTEIGTSKNTFAIYKLLNDTKAEDYNFVLTEGDLNVYVKKDTYDNLIADPEYTHSEELGTMPVLVSEGNELTVADIDALMAHKGVNDVTFYQDLLNVKKLTFKATDATKTIAFFDAYGTDKNDTIRFTKNSSVVFGNDGYKIDLKAGNNKVQFDKGATAKILSNLTNVSQVKVASQANETVLADVSFTDGRNGSLEVGSNTKVSVGNINGSDKKTTVSIGKDSTFVAEAIEFEAKNGKVSIGNRSDAKIDSIENVNNLTLSNGKYDKKAGETLWTKLEVAGTVTGTEKKDSVNFGSYSDVEMASLDLGADSDTLQIGSYANVDLTSLDFGEGLKDKMTIGKGAKVTVDTLDVDSLDRLTMSKDAELWLGSASYEEALKTFWGQKYSSQIHEITIA